MNWKKLFRIASAVFVSITLQMNAIGQEVLPLYNGEKPDGSEYFTLPEKQTVNEKGEIIRIDNISMPTLTVIRPEAGKANGTSVIICPGGAFLFLDFTKEGIEVANWFAKRGITAFILKYRLVPTSDDLQKLLISDLIKEYFGRVDSVNAPFIHYAVEDGKEAVRYIRSHASELGVDPDRIGMIGFSAGGALVASVAQNYDTDSRPDFVIPVYAYCAVILNTEIRPDAPPMFMAMTADDPISNCNINLYERWREAKRPVEMHIYSTGGHGYGMRQQNKDSDSWSFHLEEWLTVNGYTMYGKIARNMPFRFMVNMKRNIPDRVTEDWAEIKRYQASNRNINPKVKGEKRVVFMGNSITDYWINNDSAFFFENNFIDRGISGQQTDQMLVRFKPDVLDLSPSVVVILAGTNDIHAEKPPEWILNNIIAMVQLAKANKIKPVLCSVTPVKTYFLKPYINAVERINELNRMIREYARNNKIIYVDYYTSLADDEGGMKDEYSRDGVHPNLNGYKIMEPLILEAVTKALGK